MYGGSDTVISRSSLSARGPRATRCCQGRVSWVCATQSRSCSGTSATSTMLRILPQRVAGLGGAPEAVGRSLVGTRTLLPQGNRRPHAEDKRPTTDYRG